MSLNWSPQVSPRTKVPVKLPDLSIYRSSSEEVISQGSPRAFLCTQMSEETVDCSQQSIACAQFSQDTTVACSQQSIPSTQVCQHPVSQHTSSQVSQHSMYDIVCRGCLTDRPKTHNDHYGFQGCLEPCIGCREEQPGQLAHMDSEGNFMCRVLPSSPEITLSAI